MNSQNYYKNRMFRMLSAWIHHVKFKLKLFFIIMIPYHSCIPKPLISINQQVVSTTSGLYYKSFMIVIYYRNDSGQYYKTVITIIIYDTSLS